MQITANVSLLSSTIDNECLIFYGFSPTIGSVKIILSKYPYNLFIKQNENIDNLPIKATRTNLSMLNFKKENIDNLSFTSLQERNNAKNILEQNGIVCYEADRSPLATFLSEKEIYGQVTIKGKAVFEKNIFIFKNPLINATSFDCDLKTISLDIETSATTNQLYSIAIDYSFYDESFQKCFMLSEKKQANTNDIIYFQSEKELLEEFFVYLNKLDVHLIIGWHVIGFDFLFLQKKCQELNILFKLGKEDKTASFLKNDYNTYEGNTPGIIVLDLLQYFKQSNRTFKNYKLDTVAQEILQEGKTISETNEDKIKQIDDYFNNDKEKLAQYNIMDTVLVMKLFKKENVLQVLQQKTKSTGLLFDEYNFHQQLFDHIYLKRLHDDNFIGLNKLSTQYKKKPLSSFFPVKQLKQSSYDKNVIELNITSWLFDIIEFCKIDPVNFFLEENKKTFLTYSISQSSSILSTLIKAKNTTSFKVTDKLQLIESLLQENNRLHHPNINKLFHDLYEEIFYSIDIICNENNAKLIYANFQKMFVALDDETKMNNIVATLNKKVSTMFNVVCSFKEDIITIHEQFCYFYDKEQLKYASFNNSEITSKNLELFNGNKCQLNTHFSLYLLNKIFTNQDNLKQEIEYYIQELETAKIDKLLIFTKKIIKDINEYNANMPLHIQAAKQLNKNVKKISYFMGNTKVTPVDFGLNDINYNYYITKHIIPLSNTILATLNLSYDELFIPQQLDLF